MQPYQQTYIDNCRAIRGMLTSARTDPAAQERAHGLMQENTRLLSDNLFPALDEMYALSQEEQTELEEFADKLNQWNEPIDPPLSAQIFEALVSLARHRRERETLIRRLYKLGMARYGMFLVLNGVQTKLTTGISLRMRYCFSEAAGYLRHFEDFPAETQAYIIRSQANVYLGHYQDWHAKLAVVRRSIQIVNDPRYREMAPSLPWERYAFAVHQQMSGVLSYTIMPGEVESDELVDVMESAHLVYEDQMTKMRENGQPIQPRWIMPYYALEYTCGLFPRETLLSNVEKIIDTGDENSYDSANLYAMLSAPAYYMQYLAYMPDLVRSREIYIEQVYRKVLRYIDAMPDECMDGEGNKHGIRVLESFLEAPGGFTFQHISLYLMRRLAPEIFAHGVVTGRMSQRIAEMILAEDPGYFSDVGPEDLSALPRLVFFAGALHDVGLLPFRSLNGNHTRQMLGSEYEMLQMHTWLGKTQLASCASTKLFADTAYGHHRWYDGSDGYPDDYERLQSPYRAITDIVALADFLEGNAAGDMAEPRSAEKFEEMYAEALSLGGRRFSPLVTAWLRDRALYNRLAALYLNGGRKALNLALPAGENKDAYLDALYSAPLD